MAAAATTAAAASAAQVIVPTCNNAFGIFLVPVLPVLCEAVGKNGKQENPNEFLLMVVVDVIGANDEFAGAVLPGSEAALPEAVLPEAC